MDVNVIQKPVSVKMECVDCGYEHEESYESFVEGESYIYALEGCEWDCPECGHINIIEDIIWD